MVNSFQALAYSEALLFARAGHDVRHHSWPQGDFARWVNAPTALPGFEQIVPTSTLSERNSNAWELA